MPLYEYHCQCCEHDFETLIRGDGDRPPCPRCGSAERLVKRFSVPASAQTNGQRAASGPALPLAGCGAPACCGGGCSIN
jgi:putative FmdB family regulatory protein